MKEEWEQLDILEGKFTANKYGKLVWLNPPSKKDRELIKEFMDGFIKYVEENDAKG